MPFDLNAAWRDTVALLQGNKELLLVIAGLFFFLPNLAFVLFLPELGQDFSKMNDQQVVDALGAIYLRNIHWIILALLLLFGGVLSMIALLGSKQQTTVAGSLRVGLTALIPFTVTAIVQFLAVVLATAIPLSVLALVAGNAAGLLGLPLMFYIAVWFSMVAPTMAIERNSNPLTAIGRSFMLVKGNSLRIFAFYMLLFVAVFVVVLLTSFLTAAIGEIGGSPIVAGLLNSIVSAVYLTIYPVVLTAVYRQLTAPENNNIGETFD